MTACNRLLISLTLGLALSLTACGDGASEPAATNDDTKPAAVGEVLGGSISDEMIPYEDIQSQAPTLKDDPEGDASFESEEEEG